MLPRLLRQLTRPTAPDAEMLHLFLACRDEVAFGEIVRRHGPVVHRVCRRLVDASLADDAFQATFLILATRANTVQRADSLGSWLVGVAGRVARQMRKANQRRAHHEHTAASQMNATLDADRQPELAELSRILDEELTQLPDHLRAPVVACWLHGCTQDEAARALGSSVRTVRRRLEQAKQRLQVRLHRRGVVPIIATSLISGAGVGTASVPTELVTKTVSFVFDFLAGGLATTLPAALIAQGVMMTLFTRKIPALLVGLAVGVTAIGVGVGQDTGTKPTGLPEPTPKVAPLELPHPTDEIPRPVSVSVAEPRSDKLNSEVQYVSAKGNTFRVVANDKLSVRVIAAEAEYHWNAAIETWDRKPIEIKKPIEIVFIQSEGGNPGGLKASFGANEIGLKIELKGPFEHMLRIRLPHEILRCFLICKFKTQLPMWVDRGVPTTQDDVVVQIIYDQKCRELLNEGKALRLNVLLSMLEQPEKPNNRNAGYAQGHSLARFLLTRKPLTISEPDKSNTLDINKAGLLRFIEKGTAKGWNEASRDVYGYQTVEDLEAAWIAWVRKPSSMLERCNADGPPEPRLPELDTVPPTSVPISKAAKPINSNPLLPPPPSLPLPSPPRP